VFIDVFIGLWAFLLAYIWTNYINAKTTDKARARENLGSVSRSSSIGYLLTFLVVLLLTWGASPEADRQDQVAAGQANVFRVIFFVLTFFSIARAVEFPQTVAGGHRQAGRRVRAEACSDSSSGSALLISWIFFAGVQAAARSHLTRTREPL